MNWSLQEPAIDMSICKLITYNLNKPIQKSKQAAGDAGERNNNRKEYKETHCQQVIFCQRITLDI